MHDQSKEKLWELLHSTIVYWIRTLSSIAVCVEDSAAARQNKVKEQTDPQYLLY